MPKIGICPICNEGPKSLTDCDPETKKSICQSCYHKITGKTQLAKISICSECGKGPKKTNYRHPDPEKGNICHNCHNKFERLQKRSSVPIRSLPVKVFKPKVEKTEKSRLKYPDKESVIKALEDRIKQGKEIYPSRIAIENMTLYRAIKRFEVVLQKRESQGRKPTIPKKAKKPVRLAETPVIAPLPAPASTIIEREENTSKQDIDAKHPTRKATIEDLESREIQEKENFPSVLEIEDNLLYQAALRFEVELPNKRNPFIRYYPGDLVRNQNSRDSFMYGKVGKVVSASERVVRVKFTESGDIDGKSENVSRIYEKWFSLNNITLHARNPGNLAELE